MKSVKIYSTPTCVYCRMAKDYFAEHKIAYEELSVNTAERVQEIEKISGQRGVPVIVIGEEVIVGFDQEKINQLLGIA